MTPRALRRRDLLAGLATALVGCAAAGAPVHPAAVGTDRVAGLDLVDVDGGCYLMGAPDDDCSATPEERPVHDVCVGDFSIGRYEVTRAQWRRVMGSLPAVSTACSADDCPVADVSWSEVQEFLARLSRMGDGRSYRLPTEAEWEYAARSGGRTERYAGGNSVDRVAWYRDNSGTASHPVGAKAPNGLGLYDMSGNVWEMTSDWYDASFYSVSPRIDPAGPSGGQDHVLRGGSRSDAVASQRTTRRTSIADRTRGAGRGGDVGFRVASPRQRAPGHGTITARKPILSPRSLLVR